MEHANERRNDPFEHAYHSYPASLYKKPDNLHSRTNPTKGQKPLPLQSLYPFYEQYIFSICSADEFL